jgi:hypothetical protein
MSRERSLGQPGTLEIGPVKPRELNAPGAHDGFAGEHSGGIRQGFPPGIEIGIELARNSVQRQEGFAQEEKIKRWMTLESQLLHDLEGGVQWIASSLRRRNPDGLPITLEQPRQDFWRRLVAGDAVETEGDEGVAQRCGEPARLAPVQNDERERGMVLRLRHEIPAMRIGVKNGFGKSGKQRIENQAPKNKPGSIAPGFVVELRVEQRNALDEVHKDSPVERGADTCRDADAAVEFVKGACIPQIRRLPDEVDFAE